MPMEIEDGDTAVLQEDEGGTIELDKIPRAEGDDRGHGSDDSGSDVFETRPSPLQRSRKRDSVPQQEQDDKKKLGFNTTYDGFRIHGRILCLVVKRKEATKGKQAEGTGKAMMEDWISSTQAEGAMLED